MNILNRLQSVRFTQIEGKPVAVLDVDDWQAAIEWLETIEDVQIVRNALTELEECHGDRDRAGWLKWDNIEEEWE